MGRKIVLEVCKRCGGQARRINYVSRAKGRTYHYSKFVHANGVVHYYRLTEGMSKPDSVVPTPKTSLIDSLEEIVSIKMRGREMRFGEIRSLLEDSYGRSVGSATIYRNINKLLRLNLVSKRVDGGAVLYSRKSGRPSAQEIRTTRMSIGFDLTKDETAVTVFSNIRNTGLGSVSGYTTSLPVGGIDALDQINFSAYDETKRIGLSKENISYSWPDQTGVSLTLNRPLHTSEEEQLFMNYNCKFRDSLIKIMLTSDVDILRIKCAVERGTAVQIKKRLLDGLREIEPIIVKRSGAESGQIIVEAKFENATRGDTIVISLGK